LVIQVHGSKIATSEERVANWKILVNQWRNEHSFRDELSHYLVFTKNDEEPGSSDELCKAVYRQDEAPHVKKATSVIWRSDDDPIRAASPATYVTKIMTRPPYRCAVGLMIKTDEVSEQGCTWATPLSLPFSTRHHGGRGLSWAGCGYA
jgi:hypothetical protein